MRTRSAKYYDEIYAANGKDYRAEASLTHKIIKQYKKSKNITLFGCRLRHRGSPWFFEEALSG